MNPQQIDPRLADPEPQLSERLWQEWLSKNRERDRVRARNMRRLLKVVLALVVIVAVIRNYA